MSVNRVVLVGNVGKDPEVRYLSQTNIVAQFTLATTERSKTTPNGVFVPESTEWHNLVMWGGMAKTAETYVRKGQKLYVEGKLRNRQWDDAQGIRHYMTEIHVDNFEILTNRISNNGQQAQSQNGGVNFNGNTNGEFNI